jgi:hypothetical protein
MVAMTMFANVATTGRSHPLRFNLYGYRVGAMISNHFGGDSRTTALCCKEGVHIAFGFFAGYPGPMAFDCGLEKVEISVSHTSIPYNTLGGGFCDRLGTDRECSSMLSSRLLNETVHQMCTPRMRCWWHSSWRTRVLPVTLIRPTMPSHLANQRCRILP